MIIVYAPEGGDERRWDLKTARILATEAEAVERVTGLEWEQAKSKVLNGSMLATRAVAWVLLKRDEPTLRYAQFTPAAAELAYELDGEEMAVIREEIEKNPEIGEDERAALLAQLDAAGADENETGAETDPEEVPKDSGAGASPTAA
ncbi:hypothetical protein AB0E27_24935 [Streptomyces sparsogenes]|uniref:hypothetical protein n=1 Tax=Streptomyces sparsogenes TaxID=67365 RepID=UPI00340A9B73